MIDTSADSALRVLDAIRRQPPAQRVEAALALSKSTRAIRLAALQARFPERSVLELVGMITGEAMLPAVRTGPRAAP